MNVVPLIITILGGILVLFSYYVVGSKTKGGYLNNELWMDFEKPVIYTMVAFQVLAVIGFFMFMIPWLFDKLPQGGILGNEIIFYIILAIFFISSSLWAVTAYNGIHGSKISSIICVISLIISGICAIIFLAGAIEETKQRWYVVLGTMLFAITIVLSDAISWNARFIQKTLK